MPWRAPEDRFIWIGLAGTLAMAMFLAVVLVGTIREDFVSPKGVFLSLMMLAMLAYYIQSEFMVFRSVTIEKENLVLWSLGRRRLIPFSEIVGLRMTDVGKGERRVFWTEIDAADGKTIRLKRIVRDAPYIYVLLCFMTGKRPRAS